jgi:hypothetical protein
MGLWHFARKSFLFLKLDLVLGDKPGDKAYSNPDVAFAGERDGSLFLVVARQDFYPKT